MNPYLDDLLPYPFERLDALKKGTTPAVTTPHVALSIGEPKHASPQFVLDVLTDHATATNGLLTYPPTRGSEALRQAIADWLRLRFGVSANPSTQILPVNGTREALFSFGQAMLSGQPGTIVQTPNPFYQIYEGAAKLRGATPYYVPCLPETNDLPDFEGISESVWQATELVYLCSPGNPTGAVLDEPTLQQLIERAQRYDFVIAADECYSEVYHDEQSPPPSLLQAAARMGLDGFDHCMVFHSLSKRSNLPGLRSGFVAGDAKLMAPYYDYRTYHGCAMPVHVQEASIAAWQDERHVVANRAIYREKFDRVYPILSNVLNVAMPPAAFYLWPQLPIDDEAFALRLFAEENITVLPGSYLAREHNGVNAGAGRARIALVAPLDDCVSAAQRIAEFVTRL